ncbi:MAG: hypothetical protein ABQ298_07630 [Puniceicoccaceae bacterium]
MSAQVWVSLLFAAGRVGGRELEAPATVGKGVGVRELEAPATVGKGVRGRELEAPATVG